MAFWSRFVRVSQSLGRFTDMLYDKSLERDNCGFGLIAHIEGEPSHKVVRTAIHALARMQHRGAILADGKTGDGCGCYYKNRIVFSGWSQKNADGVGQKLCRRHDVSQSGRRTRQGKPPHCRRRIAKRNAVDYRLA
ncbi:hypothetical protein A6J63_008490 [Yersinia enterocolitica]|nr:hypothetical protein A6J63_008490 [Yersinia enterocolitica]